MGLFDKIFCKHKWKTHSKELMQSQTYIQNITGEYKPTGIIKQFTREVLICENCGKIKKIEY